MRHEPTLEEDKLEQQLDEVYEKLRRSEKEADRLRAEIVRLEGLDGVTSFQDYQQQALRTAATLVGLNPRLCCTGLGLTGEAGEIADLIKKIVFQEHPLTDERREKLILEAGDVLWYLALLAETLSTDLHQIAEKNLEKLRQRYPDGFSAERSLNRSDP